MKCACVGNRRTSVLNTKRARALGKALGESGLLIRSGFSSGFEEGIIRSAFKAGAELEAYLPWKDYNKSLQKKAKEIVFSPSAEAMDLASSYLANWSRSSSSTRLHYARYCHVVLGPSLDDKVDFVVGLAREKAHAYLAFLIAIEEDIPYINLADREIDAQLEKLPEDLRRKICEAL